MNNRKMMQALCFAVAVVCLTARMAAGQTGTSRVTGLVTDAQSAVVVGVKVTVVHEGTGVEYKSETTDAGTFVFDALPPASYTVKVEMSGFKTYITKNNVLTVGTPLTVNVKLEVGDARTVVEVSGTYERVQTATSGNTGAVVDSRTLTDLPLGLDTANGGRNPLVLVRLQPGLNFGANTGGSSHVNGARDRAFNYTLDGIDINESSAGGSEFSPLRTNPDSLQEFRVITSNATAEYGRNSGAQVELRTKSGTNEYHGNLYYFHRNNGLAANEWTNNRAGLKRPKLLQHQYGGSIGGPVFKNRTFFFFNFQGQRQISPYTRTRTVYTDSARQGIFRWRTGSTNGNAASSNPSVNSQGAPLFPDCLPPGLVTNCIASYDIGVKDPRRSSGLANSGLDPTMINDWIGLTPLPNDFTAGDGLNTAGFTYSGSRKDPQKDFVFKIDHNFNQNHAVFVRYAWGTQDTVEDTTNGGERRFPTTPIISNALRRPKNLAVNYRMVMTPRMVNEVVVGANHFTFDFVIPLSGDVLPFITNNVTDPLANDHGNLRTINTYQVVDNWSYSSGAHAIRAGINFRYQQHRDERGSIGGQNSALLLNFSQTVNTACLTGSFGAGGTTGVNALGQELFCLPGTTTGSFLQINTTDRTRLNGTINDLLGRIGAINRGFIANSDFSEYQPGGSLLRFDARYPEYDFYIQDNWKIRSNLTIDFGLRWELKLAPRNPNNLIFHPDSPIFFGAQPSSTLSWERGRLHRSDLNNLGPSIGFAWDPFKDGKTAVRANFRIAYDRLNTFVVGSQVFNTAPGLTRGETNLSFGQAGGPSGTAGRWRDGIPSIAPSVTPDSFLRPAPYGTGLIAAIDPKFRAPVTNMWQLSVQRELWKGIVVDVSYLGRRATGLFGAYDVNQAEIFSNGFLDAFLVLQAGGQSTLINQLYLNDPRRLTTETGSDMVRRLNPASMANGAVGAIAADASTPRLTATINGVAVSVPPFFCATRTGTTCTSFSGLPLTFFRQDSQFGTIRVIDSSDYSTYNALQIVVSRKFVKNLTFQGSYTWSKSLDTRSFDPAFTVVSTGAVQSASSTPFDLHNRRLNYGPSDFDRRHILTGYGIWDLPFGKGQRFSGSENGVLSRLIGGWQVSGILTVETGRPFTVYTGFGQLSNIVNAPANCFVSAGVPCPRDMGRALSSDPNFAGFPSYFTATERGYFSQAAPGTIGNTGRNYFTGPGFWNMDMAVLKRTTINERSNFELRFEFFNLFNTVTWGFPALTIPPTGGTSTTFSRITGTTSESRKIRVGAKINF